MTRPLLATKFTIPPSRKELVPRPRLLQVLDANLWHGTGFARKLTLVSASAGSGKTTLVAEWLRSLDYPVAWLALDENDNDPARFLAYLVAALQQVDSRIGSTAQAQLQAAGQIPFEVLLTGLVNEIATFNKPFILVLDDFHLLISRAVHNPVVFLLDNMPAMLHIAIMTREDPPLPLSRLRARNQMMEIRQSDLSFTPQETGEFLRKNLGLDLDEGDIAALVRRTEGWVAGLQLAALSMQREDDLHSFVQSFTGSNRYILDYLFEEILEVQPAYIQDFLIKTCVLERLNASLCDAVTGQDRSQALLQELEIANLFIVPLDPTRNWYRYHRLFAELLRHKLRLTGDISQAQLHLTASRWYDANDYPIDAVQHALFAEDWERATKLIEVQSDAMLKRGEFATLINWFKQIPKDFLLSSVDACLTYAWALMLASQPEQVEAFLARAETLANGKSPLRGQVAAAQAFLAQMLGDGQRLVERSELALALLPQENVSDRGIVSLNLGLAYWHMGRIEQAEGVLGEAFRAAKVSDNQYALATAWIFQARCLAVRGSLHQAHDLMSRLIESDLHVPILTLANLDMGVLYYEWNDLPRAAKYIQKGLEDAQRSGNMEFIIGNWMFMARIRLAQGDHGGAVQAFQQARRIDSTRDIPQRTGARLTALQVELELALGDLARAAELAEELPDKVDAHPFYRFLGLTWARLLIAQGRKEEAATLLVEKEHTARQAGWVYGLVAVKALQAMATDSLPAGLVHLKEALELAQPQGYLSTFAELGPGLVPLLQEAAKQGIHPEYVGQILNILSGDSRPRETLITRGDQVYEALSERELEVLHLMAAGLSNREIARQLTISLGTAKTHLHNIYGKLDARNRTHAVERARDLGLL